MTKNKALDKAFKLFQEKEFKKASQAFAKLEASADVPKWVRVRVRQYKAIAEQQIEGEKEIKDPEAIKMVSFYINAGDFQRAEKVLEKAADISEDVLAYFRAEIAMKQDHRDKAIDHLKKAIELNPDNRGYAINSPVYAKVLQDDAFDILRVEKARKKA